MALFAPQTIARVLRQRQRPQRDPLIDPHVPADAGGLADHDARAVVDDEALSDHRARMDIDARDAVGVFGHNAGQERHLQVVKFMGHAIHAHGVNAGIAEDDFIVTRGGRIAFKGGPDVSGQKPAQFGNLFQHEERNLPPAFLAVAAGQIVAQAVVTDVVRHQFGQPVVQKADRLPHVVLEIDRIDLFPGEIARKKNLAKLFDEVDHAAFRRQRLIVHMGKALAGAAMINQGFGNRGQPGPGPGADTDVAFAV